MSQILRFAIAATFLISGISKSVGIEATSQLINQYLGLFGIVGIVGMWSKLLAILVCIFELILGVTAIFKKAFIALLPLYLLTISAFTFLTFINLVSPFGGIESCGCFGELIHLSPYEAFLKNILLLIASILLRYKTLYLVNPV